MQGKILPIQRQFFVKICEIIYNLSGKSFNLTIKISTLISIIEFIEILHNGHQTDRRQNQAVSPRQVFCVYWIGRYFPGDPHSFGIQYALGQIDAAQEKRGLRSCDDRKFESSDFFTIHYSGGLDVQ